MIDIISTVLDLSNKGSEYNEEINELNITVKMLKGVIINLQRKDSLEPLVMEKIKGEMFEAQELLQKVS